MQNYHIFWQRTESRDLNKYSLAFVHSIICVRKAPPSCKSQGGEREREKQSNKCPEAEKKERERPHLGNAYLVLGFNLYAQRYILREHEVFLFLGEKKKESHLHHCYHAC